MISFLEGKVRYKENRFLILDVNGVGYKVSSTETVLNELKIDSSVGLWTHLVVREDVLDLYGFKEKESLNFFELLIAISGIGPKIALGVLNVAGVKTLQQAISTGDVSYLTKVHGIGRKIAEKIILELRDKFETVEHEAGSPLRGEADALEALKSLGYAEREAREALKKLPKGDGKVGQHGSGEGELSAGEKVKQALKILSGSK